MSWSRSGRGGRSPDWGKEFDKDVRIKGEGGSVRLVRLVGGVGEKFYDREREVVRWGKKVC